MTWESVAKWPFAPHHFNAVTIDKHKTKEEAIAVIKRLENEGFGGEGVIFPVETYVQEVKK